MITMKILKQTILEVMFRISLRSAPNCDYADDDENIDDDADDADDDTANDHGDHDFARDFVFVSGMPTDTGDDDTVGDCYDVGPNDDKI